MAVNERDGGCEPDNNVTPSTASRVKSAPVESVFPTPTPRRVTSKNSMNDRHSTAFPIPFIFLPKSSPAPRQHKSVEVLGTNARTNSSFMSVTSDLEKQYSSKEVSKKNSQIFDQAFAVREPYHSAKARVYRDSMIVLELKLNCEVGLPDYDEDSTDLLYQITEQGFLNDFLQSVSETYHRPVNTLMITVNTDIQIIMGGSTEPAYLLNIAALSTEIAATKNMRSTSLIQSFLFQSLGIPKERGVIKFLPVNDQDLATNGITVTQEIEKLEQETGEEKRVLSLRSRQSNRPSKRSQLPTTSEAAAETQFSRSDTPILIHGSDEDNSKTNGVTQETSSSGRIRARKSFMSIFKR